MVLNVRRNQKDYEGRGEGWRGMEVGGEREIIYLSLHCHHQNDSCIKMGSDESHCNVSLIVKGKVTTIQCPQTTLTFEEKGEAKADSNEVLLLVSSLMPYRPRASLYPPPPSSPGILPHGNIWVPWQSKYTVQVACKWAVAVCVCSADSNKCTIWNSKLRWPCLLATHLLWHKKKVISEYYCIVWTV